MAFSFQAAKYCHRRQNKPWKVTTAFTKWECSGRQQVSDRLKSDRPRHRKRYFFFCNLKCQPSYRLSFFLKSIFYSWLSTMSTVRYFDDIPHTGRFGMRDDKKEKIWFLFWHVGTQFTIHVDKKGVEGTTFYSEWRQFTIRSGFKTPRFIEGTYPKLGKVLRSHYLQFHGHITESHTTETSLGHLERLHKRSSLRIENRHQFKYP